MTHKHAHDVIYDARESPAASLRATLPDRVYNEIEAAKTPAEIRDIILREQKAIYDHHPEAKGHGRTWWMTSDEAGAIMQWALETKGVNYDWSGRTMKNEDYMMTIRVGKTNYVFTDAILDKAHGKFAGEQ